MKTSTLLLLGIAAYYLYTQGGFGTPNVSFVQCRYPDGTRIQVPVGNACPYDATHGGQATPCYPSNFIGPIPPGGAYC